MKTHSCILNGYQEFIDLLCIFHEEKHTQMLPKLTLKVQFQEKTLFRLIINFWLLNLQLIKFKILENAELKFPTKFY